VKSLSRNPQVGDLIIKACSSSGKKFPGIVHEIKKDKRGNSSDFVTWPGGVAPRDYRSEYGYSSINVHNHLGEFEIIRDGESTP